MSSNTVTCECPYCHTISQMEPLQSAPLLHATWGRSAKGNESLPFNDFNVLADFDTDDQDNDNDD